MRPRIICHMMSSIDGKLHPSRYSMPHGFDRRHFVTQYENVAASLGGDGWLVGRVTMAEIVKDERSASIATGATGTREAWLNPERKPTFAIGLDPDGKLHYPRPTVGEEQIAAVLGEHVSDAYLAELRQSGVSYVFAGKDGHDLQAGVEALGNTLGIKTLLLEGGAGINAAFLKAGLIDELSVLICPGIDGVRGVQTIFEGPEENRPGYGQSLAFQSVETLEGGSVWLRYRVEHGERAN
ncbi:RibD family protein [Paraburkholderia acidisoli]|uniref:5-amino-6-(5-phosphoribosylamino)uracil reductase n=1 Tax=Paraburkholderia acidisoli TaxID=2571748 RepID=A0A7Z2GKF0_9BURK|nr:dihydrofolate reductase family protein [Paraburkholderia acidisoli]QGZ63100.1 5-amino-6-(5-phosphoribosylamino)uracil reductase [Paraburkholderia acidisoli]